MNPAVRYPAPWKISGSATTSSGSDTSPPWVWKTRWPPMCDGARLVKIDAVDGIVHDDDAMHRVKIAPSPARASNLGDGVGEAPYAPRRSGRTVSKLTRMTFGGPAPPALWRGWLERSGANLGAEPR